MWNSLAKDRPQHYDGSQDGVNRAATCLWLEQLKADADALQWQCDNNEAIAPEPIDDPRVKLKVLRLLFSGGLQNLERTHRHKNKDGKVLCICRQAEPSLDHISWYCSRTQQLRAPVMNRLPMPLQELPQCFRSCAIVPTDFHIDQDLVIAVQRTLVQIWQTHISEWHNSPENFLIIPNNVPVPDFTASHSTATSSHEPVAANPIPTSEPVSRNGHVLKIIETGGVFCQKCGKSTKLQKHQRRKILSKPCVNAHLPTDQWLQTPGAMNNRHRLEKAWIDLNQIHNKPGHRLFWNQKCGKEREKLTDFGLIWCEKCGKEWA